MTYNKDKLKELKGWRKLGINDQITTGKFKGCRVGFVLSTYPLDLQESIQRKFIFVADDVKSALRMKITSLDWENHLLK